MDEFGKSLIKKLHITNPYEGFDYQQFPLDLSGGGFLPGFILLLMEITRPRLIIEVGTWKGTSAVQMASIMGDLGIDGAVICIDTWLGGLEHINNPDPIWGLSRYFHHGYPTIYYQFLANVIQRDLQDYIVPFPAEALFAYYPVRRLEAEVLIDALCRVSGTGERYSSAIPEPFTFIPEEHRSIELADGSITSQFLEMFGRPARDTGLESERDNEPTDAQRMHLLNSTHVQEKIERSPRLNALVRTAKGNRRMLVNMIYLNVLSRYPTQSELATAEAYFQKNEGLNMRQAVNDLTWALINTKEFLYRH